MGHRDTLCTHQMFDLQSDQGHNHLHTDHYTHSSNIVDYTNQNSHPLMSVSGNTPDLGLQYRDYHDRNKLYGNQYNNIQNYHAVPSTGLGVAAPSNIYNPCMVSSSSSIIFPGPPSDGSFGQLPSSFSQSDIEISMDEFGRNNEFADSTRGSCKRKNAEVAPGNYYNVNRPASSSSSSSQWKQSCESGASLVDATTFTPPEYRGRGTIATAEGSHRIVRSRSSGLILNPESTFLPQHNYLLQGSHMGQLLQPTSNGWMAHSNWNHPQAVPYFHGRCLSSGAVEMTNMAVQAFHDVSSSTNSSMLLHPVSLPNFHQHMTPVQTMHVQSYGHLAQIPAPSYQYPLNSSHPVNVSSSANGVDSGCRFPPFISTAEHIYRHRQLHNLAQGHGSLRIISSEDAALMELSGVYEVGNVIDHHRDMRLDIDDMSYEELLALEEQIGDVNTGLTEDYIIKNLKTSVRVPQARISSRFSQQNEACIICQVEYEENDIIGTLDCGHSYHGDCIKQWLLVKNLCPICKTAALVNDNREG